MTDATLEQKRAQYKQALSAALDRILNQLTSMPEVEKVILFGSYAAGRRDLFTDLDLLVVMDTEQDFLQRTTELYRLIQTDVDVDLLVYTPEELKSQQSSGFVRHALATGQVVYEKKRP
jgi:predicted nucleotidyltransferase